MRPYSIPAMKSMPGWLRKSPHALFFYACLLAGVWLFGGIKVAAVLVSLLAAINGILKNLAGKHLEGGSPVSSLVILSLLSLGTFPLVWMGCRLLPGEWSTPAVIIVLGGGLVLSRRGKTVGTGMAAKKGYWDVAAVLILVTILTWLPFSRIGYPIDGKYAYRAYFSSDYLKHFSVVEAINGQRLPPPNLYFQGEALHYYWLPYAVPAFTARLAGSTPKAMFGYSFIVNFLFLLLLLVTVEQIVPHRKRLSFLAVFMVLAPSLEGFFLWAGREHFSWHRYFLDGRTYNIDGLTRWLWNLPQIDTLLRSLFYTPQHLLSLAFLLLFLRFQSEGRERPIFLSICLALSLEASFFVGGILLLSWGLYLAFREVFQLIRRRRTLGGVLKILGTHLCIPMLVMALSLVLKMVSFGGSRVFFEVLGPKQLLILLGLNLGLLTIGGIGGLAAARFPGRTFQAVLLAVSLSLILFVRIASFESDISLKAGLIVILALTLLAFRTAENPKTAAIFLPLALLIASPGLMTAALDIRNSSDIHNSRFTSFVSFEEMRMLEWIRDNIPTERTVQNFPPARSWNLSAIPAFSGRQMFVGDRMHGQIFQVPPDLYEERIEALRRALWLLPSSPDAVRKLGIDYLFWGEDERRYFKFDPDLPPIRRIGGTVVYTLAPR